jgi:hypothetical protein
MPGEGPVRIKVERIVTFHYYMNVPELNNDVWGGIVHGGDYTTRSLHAEARREMKSDSIIIDNVASKAYDIKDLSRRPSA